MPLLKDFSPVGIGGEAKFLYRVRDLPSLEQVLENSGKEGREIKIFSSSTSILFSDRLFEDTFIKIEIDYIQSEGDTLRVGAGLKIPFLLKEAQKRGWSGLEFLAGIPGSIGGAVVNNASTHWGKMEDRVISIKVLDRKGKISEIPRRDLNFGHRSCRFEGEVITEVRLKIERKEPPDIAEKIGEIMVYRKNTQPWDKRTLGCVFKNPPGYKPAGFLIDRTGLKGMRRGRVSVSRIHANFFEVEPGACFQDFWNLILEVRERVKEKFSVELETQIKIYT